MDTVELLELFKKPVFPFSSMAHSLLPFIFVRQKEKMKRENGGKEVQEKLLFHGTDITSMKTICTQNFDWRICGSNGMNYGKGM